MTDRTVWQLTLKELCNATALPQQTLVQIVEEGIVETHGDAPEEWRFHYQAVATVQRATRLHRDLHIDWPGVALALRLLNEVEALRDENRQLRQRLARFMPPGS